MKKFALFFCLAFGLLFTACEKDNDDDFTQLEGVELHYDNGNVTGPLLPEGTHEYGVRFTPDELVDYAGQQLTGVRYFVGIAPESCEVIIYGEGDSSTPGDVLYSADVTNAIQTPEWNDHELVRPIVITGDEDIWISIKVYHAVAQQSIGCDDGPRDPNGDWLNQSTDGLWGTYERRVGESINWNIRGLITP